MRSRLVGTVVAILWLAASGAWAQGDDHALAQGIVDELGRDAAHREIVTEPVEQARQALERAVRLRAVGDERHARAADGLAREWAEVARDLVRAADAETQAADVRRKALDEQVQLERTRALVDEEIARIGRLQAELATAQRAPSGDVKADRHAVETHAGDAKAPRGAAKKAAAAKPGATGAAP